MNTIDLKGRAAVVTGGARGIGYAIAERLLASGARVSLWDLDAAALAAAAATLASAGDVHTHVLDLTQPAAVAAAAETTQRHFGRLDILVNNAGIAGATKKTWELTPEEWLHVVKVDLSASFSPATRWCR